MSESTHVKRATVSGNTLMSYDVKRCSKTATSLQFNISSIITC